MARRVIAISAVFLLTGVALGQGGIRVDAPFVAVDPIVDGADTFFGEWSDALIASDGFLDPTTGISPGGLFYFQNRQDWEATTATGACGTKATYPGPTFFVAHDIFGAATGLFQGFRSNDAGDWNYLRVEMPSGTIVECWNFGGFGAPAAPTHCPFTDLDEPDDGLWLADAVGLGSSSLIPEGTGPNLIDDRGFIVRRDLDPTTDRHWFPGDPEPGDPAWDWDDYYGCFARAGFHKTFQDNLTDPDPTHAFAHEVYEWAFHESVVSDPPLQCTEFRVELVDPPKRWIVFVAPDWWIHFGPPPVPAFSWPEALLLGLVLVVGALGAFRVRGRRSATAALLLCGIAVVAGCGGGGSGLPQKDPPWIRHPPLVPREAWKDLPYSHQFQATGQSPPLTFVQTGGTLPPGLTLAPDGTLAGTPTIPGTYGFEFDIVDTVLRRLPASSTVHVGDGPVPPAGQIPIELVSLSLQSVSPIIVSNRDSLDPRLQEAIGVVRVRGGDPAQPYTFQCISAVPPGQFLCSPAGVVRYRPAPTVPAGQYPIQIQANNGTAPPSVLNVTLQVLVP